MGLLLEFLSGWAYPFTSPSKTKENPTQLLLICKWIMIDFYPLWGPGLQH